MAVAVMATATAMATETVTAGGGGGGSGSNKTTAVTATATMRYSRPTVAAVAKMTMAMISNSHVAFNREQNGGIVDFVFVGSETQQRTVSGHKVAKVKRG